MNGAPGLSGRIAFDAPVATEDGYGGQIAGWASSDGAIHAWAEFMHLSGGEQVEAARLAGRDLYRLRIRASAATRKLTTDYRMRHIETGAAFQVLSVDALTERGWVHLRVERGVAI